MKPTSIADVRSSYHSGSDVCSRSSFCLAICAMRIKSASCRRINCAWVLSLVVIAGAVGTTSSEPIRAQPLAFDVVSVKKDSCAARETIVVRTLSSVYELIVLRGHQGRMLLRGGRHFPKFRRAQFLGSTADGVSVEPRTIDIGLRMTFIAGDRFFITSAVQSISRRPANAASRDAAEASEPGAPRDSQGLPALDAAS